MHKNLQLDFSNGHQVSLPLPKAMEMVPFRLMKAKLFPKLGRNEESTTGTAQFTVFNCLWVNWLKKKKDFFLDFLEPYSEK